MVVLAFYFAFPVAGYFIARDKGRSAVEGILLAFFLGPIGLVIELLLPRR